MRKQANVVNLSIKLNKSRLKKYRQEGLCGDATLADLWKMAVLEFPDKIAVVDNHGQKMSYRELDQAADKIAYFLIRAGVHSGDFVSVQLPGWIEFMMVYAACLKTGAIINPILPSFRGSELSYILKKCESKVLFIPSRFRKQDYLSIIAEIKDELSFLKKVVIVEKQYDVANQCTLNNILRSQSIVFHPAHQEADDVAAVLFTSGTEGFPKGVMLTHNNIIASERAFCARFHLNYSDIFFMPAPLAHAIGFHHGLTASFMLGARCVLQDIFCPQEALQLIIKEQCTTGMGSVPVVSDLFSLMQKNNFKLPSLKFFLCGGSPIPRKLLREAIGRGIKVVGIYGSTESVPHTGVNLEDPAEKIIMTDGHPMLGVEVKVVDRNREQVPSGCEGEEVSRGPNVFVGYLKDSSLTNKVLDDEGWYYSGDLCKIDRDGYLQITGRIKDIIIRGGENISSLEVENILMSHPNIREASVVGMPDHRLGEKCCAYVVLKNASQKLTLEEIITFFKRNRIATYKIPEHLEIVKELPHTESFKVKKYLLKKDIRSKLKYTNNRKKTL
jgi:acyl-CoA synthetase